MPVVNAPTYPLDRASFDRAVRRGFGRALVQVHRYGVGHFADLVVAACCRFDTYDTYCETRDDYLVELARASGLVDDAIAAASNALLTAEDEGDVDAQQARDVLVRLAETGTPAAAAPIRAAFEQPRTWQLVAPALAEVDGADGLRRVAAAFGALLAQGEDAVEFGRLISPLIAAQEVLGRDAALSALQEWSVDDADVRRYFDAVRDDDDDDDDDDDETDEPALPTLDDVIGADVGQGADRIAIIRFRRHATDAQLDAVLDALGAAKSPERMLSLMRVFTSRGLHRYDERVAALARHEDPELRRITSWALETIDDPRVREIALFRLRENALEALLDEVPRLLTRTLRADDAEAIDALHAALPLPESLDDHSLHSVCFGLRELFTAQPRVLLAPLAVWTYEHTPCGLCRQSVTEALDGADLTPDWIRDEFPFDVCTLDRTFSDDD